MNKAQYHEDIARIQKIRIDLLLAAKTLKPDARSVFRERITAWFNCEELLIASTHDIYRFAAIIAKIKGEASVVKETARLKEFEEDLEYHEGVAKKLEGQIKSCTELLPELKKAVGIKE